MLPFGDFRMVQLLKLAPDPAVEVGKCGCATLRAFDVRNFTVTSFVTWLDPSCSQLIQ